MSVDPGNPYTLMQKGYYEDDAEGRRCLALYQDHKDWPDYERMIVPFEGPEVDALDFACGPGRNIAKYRERFRRFDGVDISAGAIAIAREKLGDGPRLYVCNGVDLDGIPDADYDLVHSTIALQHICVHSIRFNYLTEFHRVLRSGGHVTIQMGFGAPSPNTVDYYADNWGAKSTNRGCDTQVESPEQIEADLAKIGFTDFRYSIGPTGPGDNHPNWIYFTARK